MLVLASNMAHIQQSRADAGLGFQVKAFKLFPLRSVDSHRARRGSRRGQRAPFRRPVGGSGLGPRANPPINSVVRNRTSVISNPNSAISNLNSVISNLTSVSSNLNLAISNQGSDLADANRRRSLGVLGLGFIKRGLREPRSVPKIGLEWECIPLR